MTQSINSKYKLSVQYSLHTKITFNINVVGRKGVGKSSFVIRQIKDDFDNVPKTSEGFQFYSKTAHKKSEDISIQIWDTAGKSQYNSMTRNFFRKAAVIILVYDSVQGLQQELNLLKNQLNQYAHESVKLCLVRTKIDIKPVNQQQRQKIKQIIEQKYKDEIFYKGEVSSKTNENVHKYFEQLIGKMFHCYQSEEGFRELVTPSKDSFLLNSVNPDEKSAINKKKKCC